MEAISTPAPADADGSSARVQPSSADDARVAALRVLLCSVGLFIASLLLFVWGIDHYRELIFDETWYVPTARKLLETGEMLHQEHPPLGKLLIAGGIAIFGDNAFGWRIASAVFGSIALVAAFFWGLALFRNLAAGLWVAAITLFDQVVYVQARIAMLDIFLIAFCTLALAFFTFSYREKRQGAAFAYALVTGVSLGLAGACKWSGFFLLFGIVAAYLLIQILRGWGVSFRDPRDSDFYGANSWTRMRAPQAFAALILAPLAVYVATYVPQMIHAGSLYEFIASHQKMHEIMSGNPGTHPYSSTWWRWPLEMRPVWQLFHIDGEAASWGPDNPAQAIVALANPFVLALGEIAVCVVLGRWLRRRDSNAMIIAVGFFAQWLPWVVNPKGLEFSFYYFPSVVCLGPAIGALVLRGPANRPGLAAYALLAVAGATFVFFLPVLSAQFGVSPQAYSARIWLDTWR
jgi:dolichyl-phosphate-mannose-protein mannosyltransferase